LLADTPDDSFLLHALALEHVKLGEDAAARILFEQLLAANPSYVGSYYHLAKLLERCEMYVEAAKVYAQGLEKALHGNDRHAASELRQAMEELEDR
jgi:tetratricopeptide (TPR) repeat protein